MKQKDVGVRRKTILNKEKDYADSLDCHNCPYFINKLVCPFHRKKPAKGPKFHNLGVSQKDETWIIDVTMYLSPYESEMWLLFSKLECFVSKPLTWKWNFCAPGSSWLFKKNILNLTSESRSPIYSNSIKDTIYWKLLMFFSRAYLMIFYVDMWKKLQ